jgi:hypothetical protein
MRLGTCRRWRQSDVGARYGARRSCLDVGAGSRRARSGGHRRAADGHLSMPREFSQWRCGRKLGLIGDSSCIRDDRMRAVQLYIKLGKRANATIRQLGYPTKNA